MVYELITVIFGTCKWQVHTYVCIYMYIIEYFSSSSCLMLKTSWPCCSNFRMSKILLNLMIHRYSMHPSPRLLLHHPFALLFRCPT